MAKGNNDPTSQNSWEDYIVFLSHAGLQVWHTENNRYAPVLFNESLEGTHALCPIPTDPIMQGPMYVTE